MKPINSQLDRKLLTQAQKLEELTAILRSDLPGECDGHFHVASVRDDSVCIVTDSPVWTTRLRQMAPQIVHILHTRSQTCCQHVRIISRMGPVVNKPAAPSVQRQLSPAASEHIVQTSSYISDPPLSEALRRLARHGSKK